MEDHRIRVGRERRERMRAHLLDAVLHVCSHVSARDPVVIDDVIRHANVSRGTFYKYFDSLDDAVSELAVRLADEMTAGIAEVYDVLEDPVMRTATGFQLFLIRALVEPRWGAFIAQIGLLREGDLITTKIRQDIMLGLESGDYVVPSAQIASDLLMGAKYEAIRRITSVPVDASYIPSMTSMVLRSFGVPAVKADKMVRRAFERLLAEAPQKLAWWRTPPVGAWR